MLSLQITLDKRYVSKRENVLVSTMAMVMRALHQFQSQHGDANQIQHKGLIFPQFAEWAGMDHEELIYVRKENRLVGQRWMMGMT